MAPLRGRMLLVVLLLVCGFTFVSCMRCPSSEWYYRKASSSCYFVYNTDTTFGGLKTWDEALEECKVRGGAMVTFEDEAELNWLKAKITAGAWSWIGLTYETGTWQWYDGYSYKPYTPIPGLAVSTPTSSDPTARRGTLYYEAASSTTAERYVFRDDFSSTSNRNSYICKGSWSGRPWCKVEDGWQYYNGTCTRLYREPEDFSRATAECFANNGHLPVPKTGMKDDLLKRWLRDDLKVRRSWIGIEIPNKNATTAAEDVYWMDGTGTQMGATERRSWPSSNLTTYVRNLANGKTYCGEVFSTKSEYVNGVYTYDTHRWEFNSNCSDPKPYACEAPLNKCPYGWHQMEDNCYQINLGQDALRDWNDARATCVANKGDLLYIGDVKTHLFVLDIIWKYGIHDWNDGTGHELYWMGLKGDGTNWVWPNGTVAEFVAWAPGVPPTPAVNQCVYFAFDISNNGTLGWKNTFCTQPQGYICQAPYTADIMPDEIVIPEHTCEAPFEKFHEGCYLYVHENKTYAEAENYCQQRNSRLAYTKTRGENSWMAAKIEHDVWIGVKVGGVNDGKYFYNYSTGGIAGDGAYFYWGTTTSASDTNDKFCAAMAGPRSGMGYYAYRGEWYLRNCLEKKEVVCFHLGAPIPAPDTEDDIFDPACGPGWFKNGQNCYHISKEPAPWFMAKSVCQAKGPDADLLWYSSKEEEAFIRTRITQDYSAAPYGFWIGLYAEKVGQWYWPYKTLGNSLDHPLFITNWATGNPTTDGTYSSSSPRCAYISESSSARWHSSRCGLFHSYICKRPLVTLTPLPTTAPTAGPGQVMGCLENWFKVNGRCLWFNINGQDWPGARKTCTDRQANLVSVNDEFEYLELKRFAAGAWIGLSSVANPRNPRVFEWVNGRPITYLPWDVQSSTSHTAGSVVNDENCGALTNQGVAIYSCQERKASVCEMPLRAVTSSSPDSIPVPHARGCQRWGHGNHDNCYYFGEDPTTGVRPLMDFESARVYCEQKFPGTKLVILNDGVDERDFITALVSREGADFWIGLREDSQPWNAFKKWIDNSTVLSTNWASGEPTFGPNGALGCVALHSAVRDSGVVLPGDWYVSSCTERKHALCKGESSYHPPHPTIPSTISPTGCPSGWRTDTAMDTCIKAYVPSTYSSSGPKKLSWDQAEDFCTGFSGGHLVSINSAAEQNAVYFAISSDPLWIGLRQNSAKQWQWSDGKPITQLNFHDTEDNSHPLQPVCVYGISSGKWVQQSCNAAHGWICEIPKGAYTEGQLVEEFPTAIPINTTCGTSGSSGDWYYDTASRECIFYSRSSDSWENAQATCDGMRADLVTVTAQNYPFLLFKTAQAQTSAYNSRDYWIGLRMTNLVNREYTWVDGHGSTFRAWDRDEPNIRGTERCVTQSSQNGKWKDHNCARNNYFICAKTPRIRPSVEPSRAPDVGNCHSGWAEFGRHCYLITHNETLSWEEAHTACLGKISSSEISSELASIHDNLENDFIVTQLKGHENRGYWIGLHESASSGFQYSDNSRFSYSNYHFSEPVFNSADRCIEVRSDKNRAGRWSAIKCATEKREYICKAPKDPNAPVQTPAPSNCKEGYKPYGTACFKIQKLEEGLNDWQSAQDVCKADGALAIVNDVYDNAEMRMQLHHAFRVHNLSDHHAWIGMKRHVHNFAWYNGCPVVFSNFHTIIPNPDNNTDTCVTMDWNGKWSARNCTGSAQFAICEQRTETCPQVHTDTGNNICPANFTQECAGFCYRIEAKTAQNNRTEHLRYTDAIKKCDDLGGRIASIRNEEEQQCLEMHISYVTDGLWIGLTEVEEEGSNRYVWKWADEEHGYGATTYENWAEGKPTNSTSIYSRKSCTEMLPNGTWSNSECGSYYSNTRGFICETKKVPSDVPRPGTGGEGAKQTPAADSGDDGLSGGAVAGIVIGALLGVALLAAIGYVVYSGKSAAVMTSIRSVSTRVKTSATGGGNRFTSAGFNNRNYSKHDDKTAVVNNPDDYNPDSYS